MKDALTTKNISPNSLLRLAAAVAIGIFILGFIYPVLGAWTGVILSAWLMGTQKPWRGFLFVSALAFIPNLLSNWNKLPITGVAYVVWMVAATLIGVLPYLFHRLTNPRLKGFMSTLPLPLWGVAFQMLGQFLLPSSMFNIYSLAQTQKANMPLMQIAAILGTSIVVFIIYWTAAVVNWMWDYDFQRKKVAVGASIFGAIFVIMFGFGFFRQFSGHTIPQSLPTGSMFAWVSLIAGVGFGIWALTRPDKQRMVWANKPETIALLRSPYTGEPLHAVSEHSQELLFSQSGERFPIRNGIPVFLKPEDVTGSNRKYNQLYEIIGGFYDSSQKFMSALLYGGRDHIFNSYLRFLEIKPGDSVLETSVGTGLNYRYLPHDVKLFGLDLSAEMLANCQANLRRWDMEAELFHGNAESLPFSDNSFEVVFHAGGINFFNDKAKALREMIRVAKPGSLILIADETEQHVKDSYEKIPVTSSYFKNRKETVFAPIDLVPPEMQQVHLETVWEGRFYVLTFRKPSL
jgi:ubiquinone/menaquinone biosynthesis C-methylase UbiE